MELRNSETERMDPEMDLSRREAERQSCGVEKRLERNLLFSCS
jgi:hypothetical protein